MSDSWDERRKAKEEEYFDKLNKQALSRISSRASGPRVCPVDGAKLEHETTMGVAVDKCPKCSGMWLDAGELTLILKHAEEHSHEEGGALSYLRQLLKW
jgi:hypothetical protein